MDILDTIVALSHEFGTVDYVRGGGGNTSCKDAATLWVKPSGTTLAGLARTSFVAMDRAALGRLYTAATPTAAAAREELVKDMMAAAVKPETPGRASVEAPLHDSLAARFVVHTHPALVNGLTCALGGRDAAAELFPEALWVPYIDPGYTLCMEVRKLVAAYKQSNGCEPALIFLQSHGVFVCGDTADEIRAIYGRVMTVLRDVYIARGIDLTVSVGPAPTDAAVVAVKDLAACALGADGAAVAASGLFAVGFGPISPDHLVYAKSYPFEGVLCAEALQAFKKARGYAPRVVVTDDAVFALGTNAKTAGLALELAFDGALVRHFARAFGGLAFLDDASRLFIENWEVESYRAKQTS